MENYLLSDIYSNLRLQNMETMMDLVCHELDIIKMSRPVNFGFAPPNPYTLWPLITSIIFKFIMLIVMFFLLLGDYLYPVHPGNITEEENSSENSTPE
jgi:hypothetical protein